MRWRRSTSIAKAFMDAFTRERMRLMLGLTWGHMSEWRGFLALVLVLLVPQLIKECKAWKEKRSKQLKQRIKIISARWRVFNFILMLVLELLMMGQKCNNFNLYWQIIIIEGNCDRESLKGFENKFGQDYKCEKWAIIDCEWSISFSPDEPAAWELSAKNVALYIFFL